MNFQINFLKTKIIEAEDQLREATEREQELEKEVKITDEAKRLLEMLKTAKVKAKKDFILNVINTSLSDIFQQDIKIEIRSSDEDAKIQEKQKKLNIKYDIILLENGIEIGRNEKLLTSNGGGVLSVISLLLKILTGYIYSKNKFYIFDESLAQVSELYQERLSLFLKQFCATYGFTIILINHNPKLATHADMAYTLGADHLKNGLKSLKIEKLDDMRDGAKNVYKFSIKNFQSIEDLEFEFDGFVSITGANNIGKSAIVRAVNSLIFNNFHETYLRQGCKESVIRMEHESKWAEMIYKSKKVFYKFWDGEELGGKKLAQDRIQEKIEQIGFKFLNISKMYKNWKADIKEQVDRLYVTTQYDKMYLIGSKTNDSDKLFNFLFNAEAIAQALLNANYDLRNLVIEQKEVFESKQRLAIEIENLKKKLKIEEYYFKRELINSIKQKSLEISNAQTSLHNAKTFLGKLYNIIESWNTLQRTKDVNRELEQLGPRIQRGYNVVDKIKLLINKMKDFISRKKILDAEIHIESEIGLIATSRLVMQDRAAKITKILESMKQYQNMFDVFYRYNRVVADIKTVKSGKIKLDTWWQQTKEQLGIVKCECCGGLGYHLAK